MADTHPVPDLINELAWLRRLARSLVADPHLAEDLTQETCVAALQYRPDADRPLRGWLARVMRNAWGQRLRRERYVSEAGMDRALQEPSTDELLERLASQRELVDAVQGLSEPYREALILRYFEELSPTVIARRQGVPVSTVKSRLARGLASLRARLGAGSGDGSGGWLAAIVPLLREPLANVAEIAPAPTTAVALGALAVNAKFILTSMGSIAVIGAAVVLTQRETSVVAEPRAAEVADLEVASELAPVRPSDPELIETPRTAVPSGGQVEREQFASIDAAPSDTAAKTSSSAQVTGRVIDTNGSAVAGLEIVRLDRDGREVVTICDATGAFVVDELPVRADLGVRDDQWTTVLAAHISGGSVLRDVSIVVAPPTRVGGWVVDLSGRPVVEARIAAELPPDFRARLGAVLDRSLSGNWSAFSDESGRFVIEGVPRIEGVEIVAQHAGYEPRSELLSGAGRDDLTIVLGDFEPSPTLVSGRVVDAAGVPVPGAWVGLAADSTRCDDEGLFRLDVGDESSMSHRFAQRSGGEVVPDVGVLRAAAPGVGFAEVQSAAVGPNGEPLWEPYIVVVLNGPVLSIAGRVVDGEGEPLSGVAVWIDDPAFMGFDVTGARGPQGVIMENAMAGAPDRLWLQATTDGQGGFELKGLSNREYRIAAMDPDSLLMAHARDIPAGESNCKLVLDSSGLLERIAGRVVDRQGQPVPNIRVRVQNDAFRAKFQSQTISTSHSVGMAVHTGEDGAFEFFGFSAETSYLRLDGEHSIPLEYGRGVEGGIEALDGDVEDLQIEVGMRCHIQISVAEAGSVDAYEVHNAEGEPLPMRIFRGSSSRDGPRLPLPPTGLSEVTAVSDAGVVVVLYRDDVEVDRAPIDAVAGEVLRVER